MIRKWRQLWSVSASNDETTIRVFFLKIIFIFYFIFSNDHPEAILSLLCPLNLTTHLWSQRFLTIPHIHNKGPDDLGGDQGKSLNHPFPSPDRDTAYSTRHDLLCNDTIFRRYSNMSPVYPLLNCQPILRWAGWAQGWAIEGDDVDHWLATWCISSCVRSTQPALQDGFPDFEVYSRYSRSPNSRFGCLVAHLPRGTRRGQTCLMKELCQLLVNLFTCDSESSDTPASSISSWVDTHPLALAVLPRMMSLGVISWSRFLSEAE